MKTDKNPARVILLVNDDPLDTELLENRFAIEGYRVETAGSGKEGLAKLESIHPDLILVGMEMDDIADCKFYETIHTRPALPYVPVIFLLPADSVRMDSLHNLDDVGLDFHVRRPFDTMELMSRIRVVLRLKNLYDELARTREELSQYVALPTLRLVENRTAGKTADTHGIMDVTVLFSDIRGFTTLSENMNPSSVFEMLNFYLSTQMEKIEEHHGVIEKLNGDEIMAIFQGPEMAQNALRCGNAIVDSLRTKKLAEDADWIGVGIGINTGQVYGGSLGSPERKHYTVVGNTVNMAARFCGFAKKFQVVFGENTERLVEGSAFNYRSLGEIPLKGISSLIEVFEIVWD